MIRTTDFATMSAAMSAACAKRKKKKKRRRQRRFTTVSGLHSWTNFLDTGLDTGYMYKRDLSSN